MADIQIDTNSDQSTFDRDNTHNVPSDEGDNSSETGNDIEKNQQNNLSPTSVRKRKRVSTVYRLRNRLQVL